MRRVFAVLLGAAIGSSVLPTMSLGKPDKVDGINVPAGRIPQEIRGNR